MKFLKIETTTHGCVNIVHSFPNETPWFGRTLANHTRAYANHALA
jgi:hypothetical protein